ncbi:MAG: hypothetical protein M1819_002096 [Sarea resinae]|nr:MAG: hypothetical protein M1819_002096 [Sarea resinae]
MAASSKTSPFLALPLEMRNQIYIALLAPSKPPVIYTGDHRVSANGENEVLTNICPAILRVNRQIYAEARPILYNNSPSNPFRICLPHAPRPSSCNIKPLTKPKIEDYPEDWQEVYRLEPRAPGAFFKSYDGEEMPEDNEIPLRGKDGCYYPAQQKHCSEGKIWPHVLRRLRHIEVIISTHAIWNHGQRSIMYLAFALPLLIDIIRCLAEDDERESGSDAENEADVGRTPGNAPKANTEQEKENSNKKKALTISPALPAGNGDCSSYHDVDELYPHIFIEEDGWKSEDISEFCHFCQEDWKGHIEAMFASLEKLRKRRVVVMNETPPVGLWNIVLGGRSH